ncbi:MAG: hypothetical protein Q4A06_07020 [Cardiobacteriaceae bacterium]|nr:hypothetical protein [Cardiobacteriaceae bacterium]
MHYGNIGFGLCFLQITADGFAAVSVTLGQLFSGLLALAVKLPKMFGVQPVASLKLLATTLASITFPLFFSDAL